MHQCPFAITGDEVHQAGDDAFSDDSYTFNSKQDTGDVFSNHLDGWD